MATEQPDLILISPEKIYEVLKLRVDKQPYEKEDLKVNDVPSGEIKRKDTTSRQLRDWIVPNSIFQKKQVEKTLTPLIKTGGFTYGPHPETSFASCYFESGKFEHQYGRDELSDVMLGRYEKAIIDVKRKMLNGEGQLLSNPRIEFLIAEYDNKIYLWRKDQSKDRSGGLFHMESDLVSISTTAFLNNSFLDMINNKKAHRVSNYASLFYKSA